RPDVFFTTVSYPIKGTPYFDQIQSKLVSIRPWRESTDRDFQIRGRRSRRFYQFADELLRAEISGDAASIAAARGRLDTALHEVEA
ncbi:MAG TPA: hypothetical protein VKX39_01280, partial [Bryobacteraceae bacterium]|nr:hypothetical protein [Bryobacteraceae bacterium]